jgi:hypothetical protein
MFYDTFHVCSFVVLLFFEFLPHPGLVHVIVTVENRKLVAVIADCTENRKLVAVIADCTENRKLVAVIADCTENG